MEEKYVKLKAKLKLAKEIAYKKNNKEREKSLERKKAQRKNKCTKSVSVKINENERKHVEENTEKEQQPAKISNTFDNKAEKQLSAERNDFLDKGKGAQKRTKKSESQNPAKTNDIFDNKNKKQKCAIGNSNDGGKVGKKNIVENLENGETQASNDNSIKSLNIIKTVHIPAKKSSALRCNDQGQKHTKHSSNLDKQRERIRNNVRKHRGKMTVEQLEEKRRKDRERYRLKKEKGLVKGIGDCKEREKRLKRKYWKINSRNYRARLSLMKLSSKYMSDNTPPSSDNEEQVLQPEPLSIDTSRKVRGRKKKKRNRVQMYRQLKDAEKQIECWKRKAEKYRKRLHRRNVQSSGSSIENPSPNTKVKNLTKGLNIPANVKKRLLFGETLQKQLEESSESLQTHKEKQTFHKILSSPLIKKYKLIGNAKDIVSYKMYKKYKNLNISQYTRKKRNQSLTKKNAMKVKNFLESDDNSKMCPGIKDYIQRGNIKTQKRLLLDSMKNLHKKFLASKAECASMCYATFCRYKPYWIVQPKLKDRDTCACVKHANMNLIVESLYRKKMILVKKPEDIVKQLVCDSKSKSCMLKLCGVCNKRKCKLATTQFCFLNDNIKYQQWQTVTEEQMIKGQLKRIKKTVKKENSTTVSDLFNILNHELSGFQKHIFIMKHQMLSMQEMKKTVDPNTLLFQIDFSENYVTKYNNEVQATHFGASKKQLSLHTGVYYTSNQPKGICFCSVSETLDHQAHAIWAHMNNILKKLSAEHPSITKVHFFSDGPTSQYRNRWNIYYLLTQVSALFKNVSLISWNYSESGHGKGPMDGVGGVLKRSADKLVLLGHDINSASTFVEKLQHINVALWKVTDKEILDFKKYAPVKISGIPQIMSVHQIMWTKKNPFHINLRQLSCFTCEGNCIHHPMTQSSIKFLTEEKLLDDFPPEAVRESNPEFPISSIDVVPDCKSPPKSLVEMPEDASPKKSINVISDIIVVPSTSATNSSILNLKDYLTKGICFICTFNLRLANAGLQCGKCCRTFHVTCLMKYYKNCPNYNPKCFVCSVCNQ